MKSLCHHMLIMLATASHLAAGLPQPTTSKSMTQLQPRDDATDARKETIRVITLNVRFDGKSNETVPISGGHVNPTPNSSYMTERPWAERRTRLVDALQVYEPDVIGFQEVLDNQINDLATLLGSDWAHVGVGRDDGKRAGECSPIFFRKSRFDLVDWTSKWLSSAPDKPGSVGWDASQTRIATLASLRFKETHRTLHVACTHYDDRGKTARAQSSLLIRKLANDWLQSHEGGMFVLLGDFNSPPEEDGYKNMIGPPTSGLLSFVDTRDHLTTQALNGSWGPTGPVGPLGTYTDWAWGAGGYHLPSGSTEKDERIDFVFAAQDGPSLRDAWQVTRHVVIDNLVSGLDKSPVWHSRWSDHRAVLVELKR